MQVESSAKDMSALSQAFSNQQTLTITSLEKQTVTVNTSSPGANSFDQWKKAQMQPKKKHFSDSAAGGTRLGMYQVTSDFSPIDHLILGNLAANKDPPRPTYFPGQLFMVPCGETKDAIVYTMSGKQKKLANGTLKLTDKTFIVFDESCSGVEFRNLVIEGACSSSCPDRTLVCNPGKEAMLAHDQIRTRVVPVLLSQRLHVWLLFRRARGVPWQGLQGHLYKRHVQAINSRDYAKSYIHFEQVLICQHG